MATYSSIFLWKTPWTEEPGGLQSMGSQRVRHDLATKQQPQIKYSDKTIGENPYLGSRPGEDFIACICAQSLGCVQLFETPWIVAHQVPVSMRFSRQEFWIGLSFPSPGALSDPGIEPASPTR